MEFSGLSVIEDWSHWVWLVMRTLTIVFFVRFAYMKTQAFVMAENRINPGGSWALLVAKRKALEAVKNHLGLRNERQFLFVTIDFSRIAIDQSKSAGNRRLPNYGWSACMPHCGRSGCMSILVGKTFNACQSSWQIRFSSHAEKCSSQSEKNGFL